MEWNKLNQEARSSGTGENISIPLLVFQKIRSKLKGTKVTIIDSISWVLMLHISRTSMVARTMK